MAEDPTYDIQLEADSINTALLQVHAASASVVDSSDNMVRASAIRAALDTEAANRAAGDAALDGRVTVLETTAPSIATYTGASGNRIDNGTVTGYSRSDPDNITSQSSGIVTINVPGTYMVMFYGEYREDDSDSTDYYNVEYKVGASAQTSSSINETGPSGIAYVGFHYSTPVIVTSTETLSVYLREVSSTSIDYRSVSIKILKLA